MWLSDRYGDVYKARIKPEIQPRGPRRNGSKGKGKKSPFVYPQPDVERTLKDVFRVAPPRDEEGEDPEGVAEWLERRFTRSIVKFQRLGGRRRGI